jgi:hypothetical protein
VEELKKDKITNGWVGNLKTKTKKHLSLQFMFNLWGGRCWWGGCFYSRGKQEIEYAWGIGIATNNEAKDRNPSTKSPIGKGNIHCRRIFYYS